MSAKHAVQRLRVGYCVSNPLQYVSVLDMGRLWERLLRRAGLPLAYTQGFHPHPRLQFATPLPVGYWGEDEWLDIYLCEALEEELAFGRLAEQCPQGLRIQRVQTVPLDAPNLQARMREAEYRVLVWSTAPPAALQQAVAAFLDREQAPRTRLRKGRPQQYDLRPLILALAYVGAQAHPEDGWVHTLQMRARCGSQGSGRPEEVLEELGLEMAHYRIYRTRLIWEP